jgi:hypothetical protein
MRYLKFVLPFLILMCGATALSTIAQSDVEVVASFKKYVTDYITSYKIDGHAQVVPVVGGKWRKQDFEPGTYSVDVKRTNSLVSPYVGMLNFSMTMRYTADHRTRAEAEKDGNFIGSGVFLHRHVYALQDGAWVPTSRQETTSPDHANLGWWDCTRSSGCFWEEGVK